MFRPQLLLLTSDSYRRQREPLGLEDLVAACTVLKSLDGAPQFVIYNGGPTAGASRQHKHLQVLPRPPRLFPDDQNDSKAVPYRYFLRYLHGIDLESAEGRTKLFEIYNGLLAEAKQSLGEDLEDNGYIPHNVALVKEWIVVIPRRNIEVEGVTANTAGMMGSVWLTSEEEMDRWKQVGPKTVLAGLGVPA
ncbi:ATP adenylyltransferase-domain-containing protein [Aspergillus cavernicola]|uniref:ATP adenylyltransferase-domain-containing protein n=1 Tax=Aspergillus cavernicola TaxID=176166 RepID=A0ABR4J5Z6_9EURO